LFVGIPGKDFGLFVLEGQCQFTTYQHTPSHMETTMLFLISEPYRYLRKFKKCAGELAGLGSEVDKGLMAASPLNSHVFGQNLLVKYLA